MPGVEIDLTAESARARPFTLETLARAVLESVLEGIANDPTTPRFEGELATGWRIVHSMGTSDMAEAVARNPLVVLPESESYQGPRPYNYAWGVEEGHDLSTGGHWVVLKDTPAREKLRRWIASRGPDWMKRQARYGKVWIPPYEPNRFVAPNLARWATKDRALEILRSWGVI